MVCLCAHGRACVCATAHSLTASALLLPAAAAAAAISKYAAPAGLAVFSGVCRVRARVRACACACLWRDGLGWTAHVCACVQTGAVSDVAGLCPAFVVSCRHVGARWQPRCVCARALVLGGVLAGRGAGAQRRMASGTSRMWLAVRMALPATPSTLESSPAAHTERPLARCPARVHVYHRRAVCCCLRLSPWLHGGAAHTRTPSPHSRCAHTHTISSTSGVNFGWRPLFYVMLVTCWLHVGYMLVAAAHARAHGALLLLGVPTEAPLYTSTTPCEAADRSACPQTGLCVHAMTVCTVCVRVGAHTSACACACARRARVHATPARVSRASNHGRAKDKARHPG
jgi:hypothetical protein